jgi:hypothetical protein
VKVKNGKATTTKKERVVLARCSYRVARSRTAAVKLPLTALGKNAFIAAAKHPVRATLQFTVKGGRTVTKSILVR